MITDPGGYNRDALILQRTGGVWRIVPAPQVQVTGFLEGVDATGSTDARQPYVAWALRLAGVGRHQQRDQLFVGRQ
jgi:hypothetical protein